MVDKGISVLLVAKNGIVTPLFRSRNRIEPVPFQHRTQICRTLGALVVRQQFEVGLAVFAFIAYGHVQQCAGRVAFALIRGFPTPGGIVVVNAVNRGVGSRSFGEASVASVHIDLGIGWAEVKQIGIARQGLVIADTE